MVILKFESPVIAVARLESGVLEASDPALQEVLDLYAPLYDPSPADPDPDLTLAILLVQKLGAEIVQVEPFLEDDEAAGEFTVF